MEQIRFKIPVYIGNKLDDICGLLLDTIGGNCTLSTDYYPHNKNFIIYLK